MSIVPVVDISPLGEPRLLYGDSIAVYEDGGIFVGEGSDQVFIVPDDLERLLAAVHKAIELRDGGEK